MGAIFYFLSIHLFKKGSTIVNVILKKPRHEIFVVSRFHRIKEIKHLKKLVEISNPKIIRYNTVLTKQTGGLRDFRVNIQPSCPGLTITLPSLLSPVIISIDVYNLPIHLIYRKHGQKTEN